MFGIGAPIATQGAIFLAGFKSAGVAIGSYAAGMQGASVTAGSAFSIAQSIGATGVLFSPPVLVTTALVGASIPVIIKVSTK